MKKILLLITLYLASSIICIAQDIITLKNGSDVLAIVTEVGIDEIRYKLFDNQNGPLHILSKSEVFRITYENGKQESFVDEKQPSLLQGRMTLDKWTGRLSINGVNIDKASTGLYLTSKEQSLYQKGDIISTVGDVMWSVGLGAAVGWGISTIAVGGHGESTDYPVFGACAGLIVGGIILHVCGVKDINRAINSYNSRHSISYYSPQLSVGYQKYGIGLALIF